jgi:hypothetical protein
VTENISQESAGPPKFFDASLHAYHALRWTPADPREPHPGGSSVLASEALNSSPSALCSLTRLYQASGGAVLPTVYVIPCVRFNRLVRCSLACTSSTAATLGMSGWLGLAQRGLSPRKKHQASLGVCAKYNSQVQVPVLQGTSPLVRIDKGREALRSVVEASGLWLVVSTNKTDCDRSDFAPLRLKSFYSHLSEVPRKRLW